MKKLLVYCLLVLVNFNLYAQEKSDGKKILSQTIYQSKLPNGLNVVSVPFESPGIASFFILVRVGSREEVEAGKTGFAHFFEHMMFRGTDKYSKEQYSEILKSIGAAANANTSLDRTLYHMTGNANMLDKMFELEADRFMNLKYSVQDFKTEAGAVKGEYTKNYSNALQKLYEATLDTAFESHTYKHTTMGFFKDVVDMPNQYDYSIEFFNRFYKPENTTILVVGDVKPERVNELANNYFGMWKMGSYKANIPAEPAQNRTKFVHLSVPKFPPHLTLSYKAIPFNDSDIEVAALDLLCDVVSSERSPLNIKLVTKEQKLRDLGAYFNLTRDKNLLQFDATLVKQEDLQYAKDEIMKAIEAIKVTPVELKFLNELKSRTKYSFAMRMDSPDVIANQLSQFTWLTGDPESVNRYYALIEKVTPEDISKVARKYLLPNQLTVSTIADTPATPVK